MYLLKINKKGPASRVQQLASTRTVIFETRALNKLEGAIKGQCTTCMRSRNLRVYHPKRGYSRTTRGLIESGAMLRIHIHKELSHR